MISFNPAYDDA